MEPSTAHDPVRRTAVRAPAARTARREVSAIGIARTRRCSRADCSDPATATLVFSYDEQVARLGELLDQREPQAYDLCGPHADRTSPPRGWDLSDTRPPSSDRPRRLDDDDTVAVIAAALRGEDAPRRVDVIDGGDAPGSPRRVTRVGPEEEHDGPSTASRVAATADRAGDPADDVAEDPLRAALEELQRVVLPDEDARGATPVPLTPGTRSGAGQAARTRLDLPPPPATPPPGAPPRGAAVDGGQDRPTLW